MPRFLVFPLVMGICGAFFFAFCIVQNMIAIWPYTASRVSVPAEILKQTVFYYWDFTWKPGLIVGCGIGLIMALWDLLRNKRDQNSAGRLMTNLFWCSCYALLVGAVNITVSMILSARLPRNISPSGWFVTWPLISAQILTFTAILWAAIRSIQTDDVLTPRVLRDKLRERSRL